MKLCVIGNSHVGHLKSAWERSLRAANPSVELTFFASRGRRLEHLHVVDGNLGTRDDQLRQALSFTSGGRTEIDPDCYDRYLVYGARARAYFSDGSFYSPAVQRLALRDHVRDSLAHRLILQLREVTSAPVSLGHIPLEAHDSAAESIPLDWYRNGMALLAEELYEPIDVDVILQPESTIVGGCRTLAHFSTGSQRLAIGDAHDDEPHPPTETGHMNADFGEVWLSSFLASIGPAA